MNNIRTDFLTPRSSFGLGMASVMNIGGNYYHYNYSATTEEADANAIRSDWQMVGRDILSALKRAARSDLKQRELPLKF
jgi:hypothetical protein